MAQRESHAQALIRWEKLRLVQEGYQDFIPFLEDVMTLLGFSTSDIQKDIGRFLMYGPKYLMIQAQRSQAKTTITAAFVVWCLIHNPTLAILVLSAGETQANEISTLITRIISNMPELECMKPDASNGDRTSVEHFDIHYSLKGVNKSPSVACAGITSNLQGKRADILIADDIESQKNSATATMRAKLLHLTLDFTSICTNGRIIWLGTPQSSESIYNSLPGRGVTVRIWPGRYPTADQLKNYGLHLAPLLADRLRMRPELGSGGGLLHDQGQPVDSSYLGEEVLQRKELDQGQSYFQLQHMLNTALIDALRYPLKPEHLVVMTFADRVPCAVVRGFGPSTLREFNINGQTYALQSPHEMSPETAPLVGTIAYIDPAGGGANGDETGYAVTSFLNGTVYALDVGGLPGGYAITNLEALAERLAQHAVTRVIIEKNMGYGAFREVFVPVLHRVFKAAGRPEPAVDDDYVHGQKEKRIISTLEPVIGRGSLVLSEAVIQRDREDCGRYGAAQRIAYSLFHQLAKITREPGALIHDDRLDALEGAVRYWQEQIAQDQSKKVEALRAQEHAKKIADPMGYRRYDPPQGRSSILKRYRK